MDTPEKLDDSVDGRSSSDITTCWTESQEHLLKGISERCNCMRWLHTQSTLHFESLNFYFTIPNVVISTLNGSFTMALGSLFPDPGAQRVAQTMIGLISIFSAILITMNQYVKSQQMMEAHRSSALAYGKLYRLIMNELTVRRDQRSNGLDFLKMVRAEIDRLENTAPSILPSIIVRFNVQFANREIEKPEITGDLDEVVVNHEKKRGHHFTGLVKSASLMLFPSMRKIASSPPTEFRLSPKVSFTHTKEMADSENTVISVDKHK